MLAQNSQLATRNSRLAWLWWTLASAAAGVLCLPVAEALGLKVVWGMRQATAGGLPEAVVTGAIIGLAQGLVLRAYVSRVAWWLWPVVTALGLALGMIAVAQSLTFFRDIHIVLGMVSLGAIVGAVVGLCQAIVLWPYLRLAVLWVPATILATAPFFPTISGLNLVISPMLVASLGVADALATTGRVTETVAFLLYGAITGLTLAWLLRASRRGVRHEA